MDPDNEQFDKMIKKKVLQASSNSFVTSLSSDYKIIYLVF